MQQVNLFVAELAPTKLRRGLHHVLGVTVATLDLPTLVPMDSGSDQKTLAAGWLAVGAALRREVHDAAS